LLDEKENLMLLPVLITADPTGCFHGTAPDLPGCSATGSTHDQTLAITKLVIEGQLAEMLGKGEPLPQGSSLSELAKTIHAPEGTWYELHFNLDHLEAVARHQQGR
jgi:predicted RNase H-like HicB family nuclease